MNIPTAKIIATATTYLALVTSALTQISYNSQEQVYSQNFDTLPFTGSSFSWSDNTTLAGWYVASSASSFSGTIGITTGSTTTGNIYSFGLNNSADRALGSIASGSTTFYYGFKAINNTATTITGFTISYSGEQWRNSAAAAQTLSFQYSIGADSIKNGTYVVVPAVGFTSPVTGGTAGLLNGNLIGNRINTGPITVSNVNWLPGTELWLRFSDLDDAGFDHGLSIDDLSFAAAGSAPAWDPPSNYYDMAAGLTGEPLAAAIHGIISNNTVLPYSSSAFDTKDALQALYEDPVDTSKIKLTYSNISVLKTDGSWDRERLWPTSRGIASSDNADSDLFNLRPTYSSVNSARGNKIYDNSNLSDQNYVSPATALAASDTSADTSSWQPSANERGDIARALFYMDIRYNGGDGNALDLALDNGVVNGSSMAVLSTLLQWNRDDPVSEEERKRNSFIYTLYQSNRNPFVDHPEYADSIFGDLETAIDDLDMDGIPNLWENAEQLAPLDSSDAAADTDGDGINNFEEYWIGSNPNDNLDPEKLIVDGSYAGPTQNGAFSTPFTTIQQAVNATNSDDRQVILVRPGTYNERPVLSAKKSVHLLSEAGAALTIIDGQQGNSPVVRLDGFQKTSLIGFTVRNGVTSLAGAGLRVEGLTGKALIEGNVFTTNSSSDTSAGGGGLYLKTLDGSRIINNFFIGNTAVRGGGVIFAGGDTEFWFNTVVGNSATGGKGGAISAIQGVHPDIRNNILWDNIGSIAPEVHQIGGAYVNYNLIKGATANSGNINSNPMFIGSGDYRITSNSPGIGKGTLLPLVYDFEGNVRPGNQNAPDIGADQLFISTDVDADGIPDSWEQQIIDSDPNDGITNFASVRPTDDFDGDGYTNFQEYVNGTNPASYTAPPGGDINNPLANNMWMYLSSSSGVTKDQFDSVSLWADQKYYLGASGSARDASAGGNNVPVFEPAQVNSLPALNFHRSGLSPSMNVSGAAGNANSSEVTIFVVAKNTGTGKSPIISTGITNGWLLQYASGPTLEYIHNTTSTATSSNTASIPINSSWSILEMRRVGPTIKLGINAKMGTDDSGSPKSIPNFTASSGASVIGKIGNVDTDAKIAEIMVYEGGIDANTRKEIYYNFASAYDISLNNPDPSIGNITAKVGSVNTANGSQLNAPTGQVVFSVTATDDSNVSKVEFYRGTTLIGTDSLASNGVYSIPILNPSVGSYTITAKAYDDFGSLKQSNPFTFSVVNPAPTLSVITASKNGFSFGGGTGIKQPTGSVSFAITANDNTGISKVEFYSGSTLFATVRTGTANVYKATLLNMASGSKTITAKAYDTGSPISTKTSIPFNFTVINRAPEIASISGKAVDSTGTVNLRLSGYDMVLSVLAYDSNQTTLDGQANLIYQWDAAPAGSNFTQPSINQTNSARTMPVHFNAIGNYLFRLTVRDGENQLATCNVVIKVTSLDITASDSDGDGWSNSDEINIYGTLPLEPDSDHDGYNDAIDAFPMDSSRWVIPPGDGTPPAITLTEPVNLTL